MSVMQQPLRDACERIRSAADDTLQWEWDSRFGTVLCAFDVELESAVSNVLDAVFERRWSPQDLPAAPAPVGEIAAALGGMRSGQVLHTAFTNDAGPTLFCAWWPWGSGTRVSIRVGIAGHASAPDAGARLRSAFAVAAG